MKQQAHNNPSTQQFFLKDIQQSTERHPGQDTVNSQLWHA
jgi:hypothetical protein